MWLEAARRYSPRMLCPYCRSQEVTSRDHIFPAFLGGRRTIGACRECNSTFGGAFEARLHRAFSQTQVLFATNGFAPPSPALAWKGAYKDPSDGIGYDLYPDLRLRPNRVAVIPHPGGAYRIVGSDEGKVRKVAEGFVAAGKARYPSSPTSTKRDLATSGVRINIPMNDDVRRLATKCCVALLVRADRGSVVASATLSWLREQGGSEPDVRFMYGPPGTFAPSDCPSHHIAVSGTKAQGVLGVLRIFELVTVYVQLETKYDGPPFYHHARLDMTDLSEHFSESKDAHLQMPPRRVLQCIVGYDRLKAVQRLDKYVESTFGRIRIRLAPTWIGANLLLQQ